MNFKKIIQSEWFYIILSFFFPLLFYWGVFVGKSFGFDCAPGVMGNLPPYGQTLTSPNLFCASILDPGAYTWQFPAMWTSVARQFFQGHFAIWSQNIGIGIPLAANFQSNAFNPILLPFILLFKAFHLNLFFLDLFFVFRYMVMSIGMYLFLRSFKLDRPICLIGSLAFFNSGYFIDIPTMAHHNVDMLLPLIAWSINNFYFKKETKWLGISILLLGLSMLGGMPESSIYILFFTSIYVAFLSLFYINKRKIYYLILGWAIVAGGSLLAAILYIPGIEYITQGVSNHIIGSQYSFDFRNIFMFILPKIFGGTPFYWSGFADKLDFNPQSWNYVGSIIFFLFLAGIVYITNFIKEIRKNRLIVVFLFFFPLAIILMLQLYGVVHFFIFEKLPGFKVTQFTKYSSTLINFSVITIACMVISLLVRIRSRKIFIVYAVSVILLLFLNVHYSSIIHADYFIKRYLGLDSNIFFALFFITIITLSIHFIRNRNLVYGIILFILLAEFYMYFPRFGDKTRKDSFRQPPAITYLKQRDYHSFRIFGLDNILFPNLASIYDLNDIRMLDALWIDRYYQYMKNFFAQPDAFRITGIKENIATQSANIVNNNFFDILSPKYILSFNNIEGIINDNVLIKEIIQQNPNANHVNQTIFTINKDSKNVLFEHAPNDISSTLIKPKKAEFLFLYPALSENLFGKKEGDGVRFVARVYYKGSLVDTQETTVDAANKKEDQKWFSMKLGPFPNSTESYNFTLELITDQLKNNAYDWAGWGGFEWDSDTNRVLNKYKLDYDKEMKIYENKDFIPRLRFIDKTVCVDPNKAKQNNYQYVVDLMKEHASDIKQLAIVESNNCKDTTYDQSKAKIISQNFQDQEVSFTYSSSQDQYGFLSDAYYPGWNIYINGKKGTIDPADLAFRGFKLPKGDNVKVEIKYESNSFKIGLLVSTITFILVIYILYKNKSQS